MEKYGNGWKKDGKRMENGWKKDGKRMEKGWKRVNSRESLLMGRHSTVYPLILTVFINFSPSVSDPWSNKQFWGSQYLG